MLSHNRRLRKDQVKDNGHDGGGGYGIGADDGGHPGGHTLAGKATAGHPDTQAKDDGGTDDGGSALREALAGEHAHAVHGDGAKDADGRAADDGLRDSGKDGRKLREQTGDGKNGRDGHKNPLVDDLVGADDAHVLAKGAGGKTAQQTADHRCDALGHDSARELALGGHTVDGAQAGGGDVTDNLDGNHGEHDGEGNADLGIKLERVGHELGKGEDLSGGDAGEIDHAKGD